MKERLKEHWTNNAHLYGWAGLAGYVIAWDALAPRTLSEGFDRALDHPVGKYAAMIATAIVGFHLLNAFENYDVPDPLLKVTRAITKK